MSVLWPWGREHFNDPGSSQVLTALIIVLLTHLFTKLFSDKKKKNRTAAVIKKLGFSFRMRDPSLRMKALSFRKLNVLHAVIQQKMASMVVMCKHALCVRQAVATAAPQEMTSTWNLARHNYVFVELLLWFSITPHACTYPLMQVYCFTLL